jgi:REP element-mobilizing transposase RayT
VGHPPRHEEVGGIYHLTARGNGGQVIYSSDTDRFDFLSLLERTSERYSWRCLAYCLMTNHYHLAIEIPRGGLSRGMQVLNGGYARLANRRHGRKDHLFKNRFFALHVDSEEHLLEVLRYIVMNPVRASLCRRPADWRWSSYRACAGIDFSPRFLVVDEVMRLFGGSPNEARTRYCAFVDSVPTVSDTVTGQSASAGRPLPPGRC